ncbi:MAG TPA: amidohydrolase [Acidimicrobiales bacterium]|nr:amidohydrolase [Acidimicrobiales bacterium]
MTNQPAGPEIGADLIVFNAMVTTQDLAQPEASAVAVKRGRFYAVGADAEILDLRDRNTRVIDAGGRRLIPGLNDAHIHVLSESGYNFTVRWEGVPTLKLALEMLREQAQRTPDGQWVKVIGAWSPLQFEEKRLPTMEELIEAVPNRPFVVQYAYNRAYLNDLAMRALGVGTPQFPVLPGTVVETDAEGRPTGLIDGYTFQFVTMETMVPQPSFDEQVNSLVYVMKDLNRFGVTSVIEAAAINGYPQGHGPLRALAQDNALNVRFSFIDMGFGPTVPNWVDAHIEAVTRTAPISPGENIHPTMAHGYEYEGWGESMGAALHDHENFDQPAIIADREAVRRFVQEDIARLIERRIPFRVHATYNENVESFLDALEEVNQRVPLDGMRWSIEHAETITPENIERVKGLGGGIALDGKMALHGDAFAQTHGEEMASHTPRLRALVESGVPLALTSDGYRASSYRPWLAISWAVTGKSISGSQLLASENLLTREEALNLYTVGAAWFEHQEHEKGRISPGNVADFALLSGDYFAVPDDEIAGISSVLTVLDGRVVFGADEYGDLSPDLPDPLPEWSATKYFDGRY